MSVLYAIKTPTSSKFIGNQHSVRCSASNSCLCSCRSYKRSKKTSLVYRIQWDTMKAGSASVVMLEVETWQFQVAGNRAWAVSLCCISIKWPDLVYESQRSCPKREREREKEIRLTNVQEKGGTAPTLGTLCSWYNATLQISHGKSSWSRLMPCLNCTMSHQAHQRKGSSSPFSVSSCQGERQSAYGAGKHKSP